MTGGRALVIVQEPGNGPAVLGHHLRERGWELEEHLVTPAIDRPGEGAPFPDLDRFDLVVPLGSSRSVHDRASIGSWIDDELALLASAHRRGTPVLGICFGGQALAAALGGGVAPAPTSEIGWYRLDGDIDAVGGGPWFQWHHDRFTPPPGAGVLATTPAAPQLFRLGTSVGTQFHPEVDLAVVARWLEESEPDYLARHRIDPDRLLAETEREAAASARRCGRLVDWFLDEVVTPARA